VADKITQQITEALTRVAAEPSGLPLYSSKSDAGLFPNTASAKLAAQKCLADDLIRASGTNSTGKSPRDLYSLTEKGWEFLLAAVNPKQVLEDFVRVLEARQGEVGELIDTARRMADSLQGLKDAVARVLPVVAVGRIERKEPALLLSGPTTPALLPGGRVDGGLADVPSLQGGDRGVRLFDSSLEAESVTLLEAPTTPDLAQAILTHLADHTGPTDCTLPELFRALTVLSPAPSIGEFHDCLRTLCADGVISLPAWTGPLYTLPEPQFALLSGHSIAYFASLRG